MHIRIRQINLSSKINSGSPFSDPKPQFPFFPNIWKFQRILKIRKVGWRQRSTQEYSLHLRKDSSRKISAEGPNESIKTVKSHVLTLKKLFFSLVRIRTNSIEAPTAQRKMQFQKFQQGQKFGTGHQNQVFGSSVFGKKRPKCGRIVPK